MQRTLKIFCTWTFKIGADKTELIKGKDIKEIIQKAIEKHGPMDESEVSRYTGKNGMAWIGRKKEPAGFVKFVIDNV